MIMHMLREAKDNMTAATALRKQARRKDGETKLANGAGGWRYAIVMTKVDKTNPAATKRAKSEVLQAVNETGCPMPQDIVMTSASQKVGRGDMWRMLKPLVLNDEG